MTRDPWEVLGVRRDAGPRALREAYRRLARAHHPDLRPHDPEAAARFAEIADAWRAIGHHGARDAEVAVDLGVFLATFDHAFRQATGVWIAELLPRYRAEAYDDDAPGGPRRRSAHAPDRALARLIRDAARGSLPDALAAPAPPPSARRWANEAYARCPARWRAARRDDPSGLPVDAHCAPRLDAQDGTLVWTAQVTVYAGSFRALGRDDPDRLPRDLLAVVARTYATFLAADFGVEAPRGQAQVLPATPLLGHGVDLDAEVDRLARADASPWQRLLRAWGR